MPKLKRIAIIAVSALFFAALAFTAFVPLPKAMPKMNDSYRCEWADGTVGEENFASLYKDLVGTDGEFIYIVRGGVRGRCAFTAKEIYRVLLQGNFGELAALKDNAAGTRLDRAAMLRTFSHTLWYAEGYYEWSGAAIKGTRAKQCTTLVGLEGDVSAALVKTEAVSLDLRKEASVSADAFRFSRIENVSAQPPYLERDGVLYLDTVSGRRLLSALNTVTQAAIEADYCDEGALLSATRLEKLTLPFVGNMREENSTYFRGELGHLFSENGIYRVPPSLKSVRVTGGVLVDFAFYDCPAIEEVNACGVDAANVSERAFCNLLSLKTLHTPRGGVVLPEGEFVAEQADCGCTLYRRA